MPRLVSNHQQISNRPHITHFFVVVVVVVVVVLLAGARFVVVFHYLYMMELSLTKLPTLKLPTLSTFDRMARILIIAIWIPFSPIFRLFDTLFAFRAHP